MISMPEKQAHYFKYLVSSNAIRLLLKVNVAHKKCLTWFIECADLIVTFQSIFLSGHLPGINYVT